jgi:predicted DNA-binding transcriptional regulator AlpA
MATLLPARLSASRQPGPLPVLTVRQAAALLGMSRTTVIRKTDVG